MKRILIAVAVLVVVWIMLFTFISALDPTTSRPDVNGAKIFLAAQAYKQDLKAQGKVVPPSVPLDELVARGLLSQEDIGSLKAMNATISLVADGSRPEEVVVRARLPDGSEIVHLADGSVQHRKKQR